MAQWYWAFGKIERRRMSRSAIDAPPRNSRKSPGPPQRFAGPEVLHPVTCRSMRKRFEVQLALGQTPIEKVLLPLKSRDELPPILAGLQWMFQTPAVNEQVFALLETETPGRQESHRPPGPGPVADSGAGRGALGVGLRLRPPRTLWPTTTVCCGRFWACRRCACRRRNPSTTKPWRTMSATWTTNCWRRSMRWWCKRGAGRLKKKKAVPLSRFGPRPTATCWKPTCIIQPI